MTRATSCSLLWVLRVAFRINRRMPYQFKREPLTQDEATRLMREAMVFHLEGLKADGLPIPEPTTLAESLEAT